MRINQIRLLLFTTIFTLFAQNSWSQFSSLETQIDSIIKNKKLTVGVAICDLSTGDILSLNGNDKFPMQSVFKFHIALAILNKIDHNHYNLTDSIYLKKSDIIPNLWSPIREKYPNGNINIPLSEIIKYTVAQSDNTGCDKLLNLLGGPAQVNSYIHSLGITDINIANTEKEIQSSWHFQFDNWTTPRAMVNLLTLFHAQTLLSPKTHTFLLETMLSTSTGSIRNNLPSTAQVAHKTGFSGQNSSGVTAANNNVGIMTLPTGKQLAYAIFITSSTEPQEVNYAVIADIGKVMYLYK